MFGLYKDCSHESSSAMTALSVRIRSKATLSNQSGQAAVEFIVLALALIPLFLLFPMIAKYQDLSHTTQMASRYVAFDAITRNDIQSRDGWKPEEQLADEVRRRFFSNTDAPIKTDDVAGDFDANRNLFWRDPYGNPLIARFSDVGVSFGDNGSSHASGFNTNTDDGTPFNRLPIANANNIGLHARGLYTANVSVALTNLPAGLHAIKPFDQIDLSIQRHTSLLFDTWSSPTTRKTEQRVAHLAPLTTLFAPIKPLITAGLLVVDLANVSTPEFGNLEKWRDAVPADRLAAPY
jgi:hypothetical protein